MTIRNTLVALSAFCTLAAVPGCVVEDDAGSDSSDATATVSAKPKRMAPDQLSAAKNYTLWSKFCIGDKAATKRPAPNYKNAAVLDAAAKLSAVATHSFSLYGDINGHHKTDIPADMVGKVSVSAHQFLGYLCGEFRDRATMVEAKINWVRGMNYLNDDDTGAYDPAGDPWAQMKAADYEPYLAVSRQWWDAKRERLEAEGKRYMTIGTLTNVDTPVPGQNVCETKYVFAEYVKKGKAWDSLEAFEAGYATFRDASCELPVDEDFLYDFRGDSNIKPNSPECNAMIWMARTVARQCDAHSAAPPYQQARPESALPSEFCKAYFQYPFTYRWNAARAGLASWILVDPMQEGLDSNSTFTVLARMAGDDAYIFGDRGPYQALKNGEALPLLDGWKTTWKYGGMGLADMLGFDKEKIQRSIQLAVDRHTDWYDSKYDDKMTWKAFTRDQAYSPFVASSYEMSESDNFTSPGITVDAPDPTAGEYKHWMFVFKIHKDNWYNPEKIAASDKPAPNFDRMWFDETSFGDTGLANSEKAWDRMGTALEAEHAALLYLRNVPR